MRNFLILILLFVSGLIITGCEVDPNATYKVIYYGNGSTSGFAPTDNTKYNSGMEAVVLDKNTLLKNGFTFIGWNTKSNGTGTPYETGDKIKIDKLNIFLYADWEKNL